MAGHKKVFKGRSAHSQRNNGQSSQSRHAGNSGPRSAPSSPRAPATLGQLGKSSSWPRHSSSGSPRSQLQQLSINTSAAAAAASRQSVRQLLADCANDFVAHSSADQAASVEREAVAAENRALPAEVSLILLSLFGFMLQSVSLYGLSVHYINFVVVEFAIAKMSQRVLLILVRQGLRHVKAGQYAAAAWRLVPVACMTLQYIRCLLQLHARPTTMAVLVSGDVLRVLLAATVFRDCTLEPVASVSLNKILLQRLLMGSIDTLDSCFASTLLPVVFMSRGVQQPQTHRALAVTCSMCLCVAIHILCNDLLALPPHIRRRSYEQGYWLSLGRSTRNMKGPSWKPDRRYKHESTVTHDGYNYMSMATVTTAEPGGYLPGIAYTLWGTPERLHLLSLLVLLCVSGAQFAAMMFDPSWAIYAQLLLASGYVYALCSVAVRLSRPPSRQKAAAR